MHFDLQLVFSFLELLHLKVEFDQQLQELVLSQSLGYLVLEDRDFPTDGGILHRGGLPLQFVDHDVLHMLVLLQVFNFFLDCGFEFGLVGALKQILIGLDDCLEFVLGSADFCVAQVDFSLDGCEFLVEGGEGVLCVLWLGGIHLV